MKVKKAKTGVADKKDETITGIFGHTINVSETVNADKKIFFDFIKAKYPTATEDEKQRWWKRYAEWQADWLKLCDKWIPKQFVECAVETKQQYKGFAFEDIVQSLRAMGRMANHLYCANRDVFELDIVFNENLPEFSKEYLYRLESLVWMVATFVQKDSFTDLVTRMTQIKTSMHKIKSA